MPWKIPVALVFSTSWKFPGHLDISRGVSVAHPWNFPGGRVYNVSFFACWQVCVLKWIFGEKYVPQSVGVRGGGHFSATVSQKSLQNAAEGNSCNAQTLCWNPVDQLTFLKIQQEEKWSGFCIRFPELWCIMKIYCSRFWPWHKLSFLSIYE